MINLKKIDFHVHTVKTFSDSDFEFDIDVLKNYINEMNVDAIAITNHNLFNIKQYNNITDSIPNIVIFPGIELNIGNNCGHMILIDDPKNVLDFNERCMEV